MIDRIKFRLRKDVNIGDFVAKDDNGWYGKVGRNKAECFVTEDRLIDVSGLVKDFVVDFEDIGTPDRSLDFVVLVLGIILVASILFAFTSLIGF